MNKILRNKLGQAVGVVCSLLLLAACSEWSDHFDEKGIISNKVGMYDGDVVSYLTSQPDLTSMVKLYSESGQLAMLNSGSYTCIVTDNASFEAAGIEEGTDMKQYAKFSVIDTPVAPSLLTDGYGVKSVLGKYVWVTGEDSDVKLGECNVTRVVKTNNGYVYYVDGFMPLRPSLREYVNSLDPAQYSDFQSLVAQYEEEWFDREASRVIGVNAQGQTVYDSVKVIRNTLMDRYTDQGVEIWNMRDEEYNSTMFVPTNDQIKAAVDEACDNVTAWLNIIPTQADTLKFKDWILKACFVNRRMQPSELSASGKIFTCVGNCQRVENSITDEVRYKNLDPVYWNPSINTLSATPIECSNGTAYNITSLKVPNHVIIYRVKARFYELWQYGLTSEEKKQYFRWNNFSDAESDLVTFELQGQFSLSPDLPQDPIIYNGLSAIPTQAAQEDELPCSVEFDGVMYYDDGMYRKMGRTLASDGNVAVVNLPAGEYYLRMGFKHQLQYSVSIYFKGADEDDSEYVCLKKDMVLYAQGSNYHMDRGAAGEIPHYGEEGIAYAEGFDVDYWQQIDPKAIAYDTDGYTVGIVNLKKPGNFTIKIESSDIAHNYKNYTGTHVRTKSDLTQLMMYHWCLRPTKNNY